MPHTLLLNVGLAINNQSSQQEAARLLVDFLTSKESQESIRKHTLSIPGVKEAAELELQDRAGEPAGFRMFRELIPSYRYYTDMVVETRHLRAMIQQLKLYWSNMETVSGVIRKIEQALNDEAAARL